MTPARCLLLFMAFPSVLFAQSPAGKANHWAYIAPVRPAVPIIQHPKFEIRNPIDAFVQARSAKDGLLPSPPADRAVLLRRLTLDLTGLPPTIEEVDSFLSDKRADAYERRVDRLLASPGFGERWARHWLDLARYADSHGFQRDELRDLWPYRDWVIHALNADMPFDRFTIEQLAGDLLKSPSESQLVATGFHRCSPCNIEAGTDPEDSRVMQVIDRVNVTATVWLGTTLECAQCHDHKYDPFSQRDYYQFLAFFNSTVKEAERSKPELPGSIMFIGPRIRYPGGTTLFMEELPRPRKTHIFVRGDYRNPGPEVKAATPAALPSLQAGSPNRLDLARWLVSRDNPLTARVTVNHWWAEIFGEGLVRTPEDFGTRGEPPTHPELLDWLAVELMDHDWSMKHLVRLVVTSATYRQSSRMTPELRERDPENRLLARGPRFRMDAEMIRDNALTLAGLLNRKLGGRPAHPYQPEGLWPKVSGEKTEYVVSTDNERYRRGVYVVIKRSSPYPSLVNFDAPNRLTCTVKRARSTIPMQALTLLNDPVYVEMAKSLAERIRRDQPAARVSEQLRYAFRLCLAREPKEAEQSILENLYRQSPTTSGSPASAWQSVASVLLNLDETIVKP